jgi:hypothetical protein
MMHALKEQKALGVLVCMEEHDNGQFTYDHRFAPLSVAEAPKELHHEWTESLPSTVKAHLQESVDQGVKDHLALLPNGLSVGEAGLWYLRTVYPIKKKKIKQIDPVAIQTKVGTLLHSRLQIDMTTNMWLYRQMVSVDVFKTNHFKTRLYRELKRFLREIGYRSKQSNFHVRLHALISEL